MGNPRGESIQSKKNNKFKKTGVGSILHHMSGIKQIAECFNLVNNAESQRG